jgi:hypothetical protein
MDPIKTWLLAPLIFDVMAALVQAGIGCVTV